MEMPGVVGIYTAEHLEPLVPPVRATSRMRNYHATPIYPLARGRVRYVGEPVVAVVAESRYLAEDALDRIEIAYEPLTPVVDPELAILQDAPLLHEEAGTNVLAQREFARGDIEAEMAAAPVRVGGRFRFHRKTPVGDGELGLHRGIRSGSSLADPARFRRRSRASFATCCRICSTYRDTVCVSSLRMSVAVSAARPPCIKRRSSSPSWPVILAAQCAGPGAEQRT